MKKAAALIVLVCLCLTSCSAAKLQPFEKHWAYNDIIELEEKNFINMTDENFKPDEDISRGEFLNLLINVMVSADAANIKGGLFKSKKPIKRGEAVYIIAAALKLKDKRNNVEFSDGVDDPYVYAIYNAGYMKGYADKSFKWSKNLTKAECMVVMNRISSNMKSDDDINFETERKFLIHTENIPYDLAKADKYEILQTYVNYSPEVRVREINGYDHWFALKMPKDSIGLSRLELEFPIINEEYESLYSREENTLKKTRYQFLQGEHMVAIDIYDGDLKGLAVAEIEFESVEDAEEFVPFDWFIKDVTSDKRYKNAGLAKDGFPE